MSTPMPGWYPDPEDPGRQRFWDGQQWTDARAFPASDVGATQPAPTTQSSGNGAWPWVVGLIVVGLLLLGLAYMITQAGEDDETPIPTVTQTERETATATATATATETATAAPTVAPTP
jgi:hypothetical protein